MSTNNCITVGLQTPREEKERAAAAAAEAAEAQSAPAGETKEAAEKAAKKLDGNARYLGNATTD